MVLKKKIAIINTKGGVGKTIISINLAKAMHNYYEKVVLVDANILTPHVGAYLGKPITDNSLFRYVINTENIKNLVHVHKSGLHVLLNDLRARHDTYDEISYNLRTLHHVIDELEKLYDFIIFDTPPYISSNLIEVLKVVDEAIVVVNQDIASLAEGLRSVQLAKNYDVNVIGVILNKYGILNKKLEQDIANILAFLDLPVLAVVPYHNKIAQSIKKQQPFVSLHANKSFSKELLRLGHFLVKYNLKYS